MSSSVSSGSPPAGRLSMPAVVDSRDPSAWQLQATPEGGLWLHQDSPRRRWHLPLQVQLDDPSRFLVMALPGRHPEAYDLRVHIQSLFHRFRSFDLPGQAPWEDLLEPDPEQASFRWPWFTLAGFRDEPDGPLGAFAWTRGRLEAPRRLRLELFGPFPLGARALRGDSLHAGMRPEILQLDLGEVRLPEGTGRRGARLDRDLGGYAETLGLRPVTLPVQGSQSRTPRWLTLLAPGLAVAQLAESAGAAAPGEARTRAVTDWLERSAHRLRLPRLEPAAPGGALDLAILRASPRDRSIAGAVRVDAAGWIRSAPRRTRSPLAGFFGPLDFHRPEVCQGLLDPGPQPGAAPRLRLRLRTAGSETLVYPDLATPGWSAPLQDAPAGEFAAWPWFTLLEELDVLGRIATLRLARLSTVGGQLLLERTVAVDGTFEVADLIQTSDSWPIERQHLDPGQMALLRHHEDPGEAGLPEGMRTLRVLARVGRETWRLRVPLAAAPLLGIEASAPEAAAAGVHLAPMRQVLGEAPCPVCGMPLMPPVVTCLGCEVPVHAGCMDFVERCPTYGCRGGAGE